MSDQVADLRRGERERKGCADPDLPSLTLIPGGSDRSHSIVLTATAAVARFQPLLSVRREGRMTDRLTRLAYGLGGTPYAAKWGARDV